MNQHCFIKRMVAMALVLVIAFGLLPTGALGAERSSAIPVDSETKLQQTISSARDHEDTGTAGRRSSTAWCW